MNKTNISDTCILDKETNANRVTEERTQDKTNPYISDVEKYADLLVKDSKGVNILSPW